VVFNQAIGTVKDLLNVPETPRWPMKSDNRFLLQVPKGTPEEGGALMPGFLTGLS